jgi:hypothetical protein
MTIEIKLNKKCVNSKILFTEITNFISEGFNQIGSIFNSESGRLQFIVVLNDFFFTLQQNGIITHWNVMCDLRNNKVVDMENGQFRLTTSYKQRNCLNTTELQYLLRVDKSEDWSIDFTL